LPLPPLGAAVVNPNTICIIDLRTAAATSVKGKQDHEITQLVRAHDVSYKDAVLALVDCTYGYCKRIPTRIACFYFVFLKKYTSSSAVLMGIAQERHYRHEVLQSLPG
jgi:hypothetical protein